MPAASSSLQPYAYEKQCVLHDLFKERGCPPWTAAPSPSELAERSRCAIWCPFDITSCVLLGKDAACTPVRDLHT